MNVTLPHNIYASVTKQYDLVLAKVDQRCAAGNSDMLNK